MSDPDAVLWPAIVETLKAVDLVLAARHRVEATHGTPAEAAAIDELGARLNHLEDAFDALRTHHEHSLKDR